jgi:Leucine-rich repeat (LRR) protein
MNNDDLTRKKTATRRTSSDDVKEETEKAQVARRATLDVDDLGIQRMDAEYTVKRRRLCSNVDEVKEEEAADGPEMVVDVDEQDGLDIDFLESDGKRESRRPSPSSRQDLASRLTDLIARSEHVDDDYEESLPLEMDEIWRQYRETFRHNDPVIERNPGAAPEPGAFRVVPGRSIERVYAADPFTDGSEDGRDDVHATPPAPPMMSAQGSIYMAEANLVAEDETRPLPLLVEARLIQRWFSRETTIRRWQIALLALAVIAIIVGLSVGITVSRPALPTTPGPTTPVPTTAPTSLLDERFRPTLPSYSLDSLRNASSPQHRAYEWVTEVDKVSWMDAPNDEDLRLKRMKQRFALATLFYATGGDGTWALKDSWLNITAHECTWYRCCCGPTCDANDGVGGVNTTLTWLDLSSNGLELHLPREVGLLSSLTILNAGNNFLTGSLPTELGALTLLQYLVLNYNQFTQIPTELGLLSSLKLLYLDQNYFSGPLPTELGELSALKFLDLSYNEFNSSIPTQLGLLSNLMHLWMSDNMLTGHIPTEISNLSALSSLLLIYNELSSTIPTELGTLTNLKTLDLSFNMLTGSIASVTFGPLAELHAIVLSSNELTGTIPSELGQLSALSSLVLYSNKLTSTIPSQLSALANLQALDLSNNALTGPVPTYIGELSALSVLDLSAPFCIMVKCTIAENLTHARLGATAYTTL